jgi:hypothetical protein
MRPARNAYLVTTQGPEYGPNNLFPHQTVQNSQRFQIFRILLQPFKRACKTEHYGRPGSHLLIVKKLLSLSHTHTLFLLPSPTQPPFSLIVSPFPFPFPFPSPYVERLPPPVFLMCS